MLHQGYAQKEAMMQIMNAKGMLVRSAAVPTTNVVRWHGIDQLRVCLTMLVIGHHVGQAYGPTGGEWPVSEAERVPMLGTFFATNAAFFMSLFFLLAGLFTPTAYDRRGTSSFLVERILRLGLPLLVFSLLFFAPLTYFQSGNTQPFWRFVIEDYLGKAQFEFGHLWFVLHLLIYSLLYAFWRNLGGVQIEQRLCTLNPPSHAAIFGFALVLAGITALVRQWYPIDTWVRLFSIVPAEIAHLPHYGSMFLVGVLAGRAGWFQRFDTRAGMVWLLIGLLAVGGRYLYGLWGWQLVPGLASAGGVVWSYWETLICVGLCVGLPVLFREVGERGEQQRLAANTYGAYLIHIFPVVGLQTAFLGVELAPLLKFLLVSVLAIPLSFLLAAGLRRIPGVKHVM
jgi:glucans biosynthesis protein C